MKRFGRPPLKRWLNGIRETPAPIVILAMQELVFTILIFAGIYVCVDKVIGLLPLPVPDFAEFLLTLWLSGKAYDLVKLELSRADEVIKMRNEMGQL